MKLAVISLVAVAFLAPFTVSTSDAAPRGGGGGYRGGGYSGGGARVGYSPGARGYQGGGNRYYAGGGRAYAGNRYYGNGGRYYHGGRYGHGHGHYHGHRHYYPYYPYYYPYYGLGFYPYGYGAYYGGAYYGTGVSIGYAAPVYDAAPYPYYRPTARVYQGKVVAESAPGRVTTPK